MAAFDRWCAYHGKSYSSLSERASRYAAFLGNLARVQAHASSPEAASFSIGLNGHADLTTAEFRAIYFGAEPKDMLVTRARQAEAYQAQLEQGSEGVEAAAVSSSSSSSASSSNKKEEKPFRVPWPYAETAPPSSIDWEDAGILGPIKNQHVNNSPCGCCFAFGGVAGIETAAALYTGEVVPLSEQQVVSCDDFDFGCEGGAFDSVFRYAIVNGGLDTEADWPYLAYEAACPRKKERTHRKVTIDAIVDVPEKNEEALLKTIAHRPASVGVCCGDGIDAWHLYTGGIFNTSAHCVEPIDHAVLIVGYGTTDEGTEFWKIRNSWGAQWGDRGYMYVLRNVTAPEGQNGVATFPGYPIKTTPNPTDSQAEEKDAQPMAVLVADA